MVQSDSDNYISFYLIIILRLANTANNGGAQDAIIQDAPQEQWNNEECDRFSFEDSDRFEEDSLCSWSSEPESLCNNWRGWKRPNVNSNTFGVCSSKKSGEGEVTPLTELAARCVASFIPFELVEHVFPPVPEQLQLRIAFWSFPDNEEDIRLYSCLANSSADEFHRGDSLFKNRAVKDPLQIGFHLSATVVSTQPRNQFNVAVTFDRRRISSCNCTCTSSAYWCSHVVAVCLYRIHCPHKVSLRAPVSESLTRLQRDQLQKFAQYLISELPQQILPTAQRLLDELLSAQPTTINTVCGAPDPTAGASANDQTNWYLDEKTLHDNLKKILIKFCLPTPMVFSDVNYLSNSAPPAAAEWSSLLRPLRGREPEGMWNLLSIVREMYRRCDRNAIRLLEIITEECMACDQVLVWWFNIKLSLLIGSNGHSGGKHSNTHSNSNATQHACASLCDEIVILWRLAALNPGLAPDERDMLHAQFTSWHLKILDRVAKCMVASSSHSSKQQQNLRNDAELFTGFKSAIEACYLDWEDYPIPGITHTQDTNPMYHCPFTCFKHSDSKLEVNSQVNSSQALLTNNVKQFQQHLPHAHNNHLNRARRDRLHRDRCYVSSSNNSNSSSDSANEQCANAASVVVNNREYHNRSSVSSEGFCENDDEVAILNVVNMPQGESILAGPSSLVSIDKVKIVKCIETDIVSVKPGTSKMSNTNIKNKITVNINKKDSTISNSSTSSSNTSSTYNSNNSGLVRTNSSTANNNSNSPNIINTNNNHNCINKSSNNKNSNESIEVVKDDNPNGKCNSDENSIINDINNYEISGSNKLREVLNESATRASLNNITDAKNPTTSSSSSSLFISKSANIKNVNNCINMSSASTSSSSPSSSASSSHHKIAESSKKSKSKFIVERLAKPTSSMASVSVSVSKPGPSSSFHISSDIKLKNPESPRRASKDESLSSSDSCLQNDEYTLYYYDTKAAVTLQQQHAIEHKIRLEQQQLHHQNANKYPLFSNLKPTEDAWDILFARAEGLHAHGHGREACILGVRLAEEMLANPPNLMIELPPPPKRKGKKQNVNPISHQLSVLASATLAKCAFLCTVLAENSEHYHLGYRVCLFGLELPRPPASTKPLEVKLANQESDLLALLKRIPLGQLELAVIRERAEQLRDGTLRSRGEALLPIMLASFIFDALVMPGENRMKLLSTSYRLPTDENLGFEAAVAALGLKANVSEAEHPLLCEGTRRQRGDLALTLLYYYKDEPHKICRIIEKLLDREIHTLIKSPFLPSYYSNNPPTRSQTSQMRIDEYEASNHFANNELYQNDFSNVNSRPHSTTSAELENGMNVMSISQHNNITQPAATNNTSQCNMMSNPSSVVSTTRSKDSRYKGKRAYPSIPNQPSEASAHFMFELAKNVLTKAGGTSSTSLFTQASTSQNHHGPHRALHMCAFQLGLYALGLHNCVSANWLSRTYSSHVSWIMGQAMEIGAPAISFLIDTWEGHLTPPEAAGMADRASSRGWDSNMVYPAAELALSVLPHAAALNPNEIQRAISQCKEQSDRMLERACITVENAAKSGGVYPEVLFQVARYWYELYLRNTPGGELEPEEQHDYFNVNLMSLIESGEIQQQTAPPPTNQQVVVTAPPQQAYQQTVTTLAPIGIAPFGPYSFPCQGIYHQNIPYHTTNQMQMYISTPPQFQYPPPTHTNNQSTTYSQPVGSSYQTAITHPPVTQQGYAQMQCPTGQQFQGVQVPVQVPVTPSGNGQIQPNLQFYSQPVSIPQPQNGNLRNPPNHHPVQAYPPYVTTPTPPVRTRHPHQFSPTQLRYLLAAYNVGMLALETLARRVHDDRPQAKYARNPPYGEDVKWLLRISKKLGTQYLHQFCVCAVNSIVSPYVLHDVAIESAHYLARNNPTLVMQHLRSALTPLVQKCQQMYIQCIHQKLYHLTVADYEEFTSTILSARSAFQISPEGNAQFKDWLQSIRRSKSCKKELWTQINTALQANSK